MDEVNPVRAGFAGSSGNDQHDMYERTWLAWAADIAREHPGWDVTWGLLGFEARRDGEIARSASPSGIRALMSVTDHRTPMPASSAPTATENGDAGMGTTLADGHLGEGTSLRRPQTVRRVRERPPPSA